MQDAHIVEQALAYAFLRCLSGALDPRECMSELEMAATRLFQLSRVSNPNGLRPALAIFEALSSFVDRFPVLKKPALSFLLLLSLCSPCSWLALVKTVAFEKYPELSDIVAEILSQPNPYFRSMAPETSKEVLCTLSSFSDLDFWEERGRLFSLPVTPLSIVINRICSSPREEHTRAITVQHILQNQPPSALESISSDNLPMLLKCLIRSRVDVPSVKRRVHVAQVADRTPMSNITRIVRADCSSFSSTWLFKTPMLVPCSPANNNENTLPDDSSVPNSCTVASSLVTALVKDGNDGKVIEVARNFMLEEKFALVAEAYLAAPNVLHRLVEGCEDILTCFLSLPLSLRSPVDAAIDSGLAKLLSVIPELSTVLSTHTDDYGKSAERSLNKIALIYPFILGRRLPCFIAACDTVLHGLTHRDLKYHRNGLRVLEVIFAVIAKLPDKCLSKSGTEGVCLDALQFLLEENRIENGVPKLFSALAKPLFKTIALLPKGSLKTSLPDMLQKVIKGRGTCEDIREGAEHLLASLPYD